MSLLNTTWAVETADRAIKSFAQAVILGAGASDAGPVNAFAYDWKLALGFGLGGAVLSVLTSMASGSIFRDSATPASVLPPPPLPDPDN
jgi:hypothetical protein